MVVIVGAFVVVFLLIFAATAAVALLGISGFISIPQQYEKYLGKLVYALLLEVAAVVIAVFSSFFLGGVPITLDEAPSSLDEVFSPKASAWIPFDRETGVPLEVEVRVVDDNLVKATSFNFNTDLSLELDDSRIGRYEVVHEQEDKYRLGYIDTEDLKEINLLSRIEAKIECMEIRRIYVDSTFVDSRFPFEILVYEEGPTLRFSVKVRGSDSVTVDRAANKELYRVLSIDGGAYLIAIVLSVPSGTLDAKGEQTGPPFAEFAIAQLSKGWAESMAR